MTDPDPEGPKTSGSGSTTRIFPDELFVEKDFVMFTALIV